MALADALPKGENTRAGLTMVFAMLCFAVEDVFIKQAAVALPPGQVLVILGLLGGSVFSLAALWRKESVFSREALRGTALLRNLAEGGSAFSYILVLSIAPLAMAAAILQAMPLMVTAGAALFLGEKVGWRRWTSIFAGFIGVVIILDPWKDGLSAAGLLMLLAVVLLAVRDLVTRNMPKHIGTMSISAWGFLALAPAGALLMLVQGSSWIAPSAELWRILGCGLVAGVIGYYAVTQAMRIGEVAFVAPFRYTRLVFAVALAILFLGERLTMPMVIGSVIVVCSGLYAFARERRRKAESGH